MLLVAPSVPEFAGASFGILAAGAIAVTANTMSTRPELEYLGSDAEVAVVVGTALRAGASLSLLARFDAEDLLDLIRRDKLTIVLGVPTMWNALLRSPWGPAGSSSRAFASRRRVAPRCRRRSCARSRSASGV